MDARREDFLEDYDSPPTASQRVTYRITVRVAATGPDFWGASYVANGDATTTITARVDQAALRGILGQLWDLNATLISIVRVSERSEPSGGIEGG